MTTDTTSRPFGHFAEKLSAFRAGLNKDEQDLLDEIVSNSDVEAHAAAWPGWDGKVLAPKAGDDVEAHAMPRDKFAPKASEGEDVEAHARQMPKAAERASRPAFKFNAARASYEIGDGTDDDVEAHMARMPKATDARVPAAMP